MQKITESNAKFEYSGGGNPPSVRWFRIYAVVWHSDSKHSRQNHFLLTHRVYLWRNNCSPVSKAKAQKSETSLKMHLEDVPISPKVRKILRKVNILVEFSVFVIVFVQKIRFFRNARPNSNKFPQTSRVFEKQINSTCHSISCYLKIKTAVF